MKDYDEYYKMFLLVGWEKLFEDLLKQYNIEFVRCNGFDNQYGLCGFRVYAFPSWKHQEQLIQLRNRLYILHVH